MKLGVTLLALLAVACIVGSIIAANEDLGVDHGQAYVFHTWWFLGMMGLLMVNLVLATWERSYNALTLYRKKNIIKNPAFYRKAKYSLAIPFTASAENVAKILRKTYTTVHQKDEAFYCQKGLTQRTGFTIIHIGLISTCLAGFYGVLADENGWGVYDSTLIIPEGQTTTKYFSRKDRLKAPVFSNLDEFDLPFAVRALDFTADYHPNSTVAEKFIALVEITDGEYSSIREVTMAQPIFYKGYKLTQNSFSPNERIVRGRFRIEDTTSGQVTEVDVSPGDPVKVYGLGSDDLFFQVDTLEPDTQYEMLDLAASHVIQEGSAIPPAEPGAVRFLTDKYDDQIKKARYGILVAAMFPNFIFDENMQPTTRDDQFENPAVLAMVFRNGRPHGHHWLFYDDEAQRIVGQPHPDIEMHFQQWRQVADSGTSAPPTLFDYEIELQVLEKSTSTALGSFWVKPGVMQELPIEMLESIDDPTTGLLASMAADVAANQEEGRYKVSWIGTETGHVTFLGFMRDPTTGWLYAAVLIILLGTCIAFMFKYRETWVYLDRENGVLYMATQIRGQSDRALKEFDKLAETLKNPDMSAEAPTAAAVAATAK